MNIPDADLYIATAEDMQAGIKVALSRLGLKSVDELRAQAIRGEFQSEAARLTWFLMEPCLR